MTEAERKILEEAGRQVPRNYLCVSDTDADCALARQLAERGLLKPVQTYRNGRDTVYVATDAARDHLLREGASR